MRRPWPATASIRARIPRRALERAGVGDEQEREVRRDEQRVDLGGDLPRVEKVPNVRIVGATPMWEWVGAGATVLSD